VTGDDLRRASRRQGVSIASDSVALVRTGYGAYWGDPEHYLKAPGVDRSGSEWLTERGVFAVGIDNVAWDIPGDFDPAVRATLPGHVVLLVRAGIYIIENVYLESLAADGVDEFLFVCLPLKFQGGTGSPVRPSRWCPTPCRKGSLWALPECRCGRPLARRSVCRQILGRKTRHRDRRRGGRRTELVRREDTPTRTIKTRWLTSSTWRSCRRQPRPPPSAREAAHELLSASLAW
jgi:hypothetical protein